MTWICRITLEKGTFLAFFTQFCATDNSRSGIPCIAPGRAYNLQYGTDRQIDLRSRDVNLKMKSYLEYQHTDGEPITLEPPIVDSQNIITFRSLRWRRNRRHVWVANIFAYGKLYH